MMRQEAYFLTDVERFHGAKMGPATADSDLYLAHMQFTAAQIAHLLHGTVEGDANATVTKLSKVEEVVPVLLSFLANPAYRGMCTALPLPW